MMKRTERSTAARALVALAAVITLGGCATKGDIRDLQSEIQALAARQETLIEQLRAESQTTQDTLRTQSDQLFDFRGQITRQLREISRSLTTLEAIVGENQRGIAGVRDQLANLRRIPVAPPPLGADSAGAVEEGATGVGGDAEQLYNAAVGQLNRGSQTAARMAFQQFLDLHPNHELAPDARFYLADLMVQQGRLDDALDAFQEIQSLFPTAEKVPEALYRIALIQIQQEDLDDAEETLERIVNTYPGTGVALLAEEKLNEIR